MADSIQWIRLVGKWLDQHSIEDRVREDHIISMSPTHSAFTGSSGWGAAVTVADHDRFAVHFSTRTTCDHPQLPFRKSTVRPGIISHRLYTSPVPYRIVSNPLDHNVDDMRYPTRPSREFRDRGLYPFITCVANPQTRYRYIVASAL